MRAAIDLLSQYAEYHRDRRNILSHFLGVPLIVFAVGVLMARPLVSVGGLGLTPAWLLLSLTCVWYLTRGNLVLGVVASAAVGLVIALAHQVADGTLATWLTWGVGVFVAGWVIQFIGHWYEGRKPAFLDDILGLVVAPMFIVAELMFMLGWNKPMLAEIERRAGPTVLRDLARIA